MNEGKEVAILTPRFLACFTEWVMEPFTEPSDGGERTRLVGEEFGPCHNSFGAPVRHPRGGVEFFSLSTLSHSLCSKKAQLQPFPALVLNIA